MRVNLFIIGVNKSGSSWLHYLLDSHPAIYMSKIKEHNYFGQAYPNDLDKYHQFFPFTKPYTFFGESTPTYYYSKNIAEEIISYSPDAKIIAIVRDPIKRLISHFNFRKQLGAIAESTTIEEAISGLDPHLLLDSHYEKTLPAYQEIFGPDQFKIVSLEEGITNTTVLWDDLQKFLELDSHPLPKGQNRSENATGSKSFRFIYSSTIMPIKRKAPWLYRALLKNPLVHKAKNQLLNTLGTAEKIVLSPELLRQLQKEFAPTYAYLEKLDLISTYNS